MSLFALIFAGAASAADPVPIPNPVAVPGIVELSKVAPLPPRATDVDLIDVGKTRFYKIANYEGPVTYEVEGDAVLIKEVEKAITLGIVIQGETEPSYPDVPAGSVILWGKKPGTVELSAWGVVNGRAKRLLTKSFRVGGLIPPPIPPPVVPPVPPVPDPPVTPPSTAFYFLVVRKDGPADPAFTRTMGDPAWADLRKAGHLIKDKTLTEAAQLGLSFPAGTKLPCVVTLQETADGKNHKIVRDAIALPTTGDGIRKLPEGVK